MPLHARRRRQKELADREAAGEDLWTEEFSAPVRVRMSVLVRALTRHWAPYEVPYVRAVFMRELGIEMLSEHSDRDDLIELVRRPKLAHGLVPSFIEAVASVHAAIDGGDDLLVEFENDVNDLLSEERIAFRLIEGQMVEFDSTEMHTAVVEPAIRLLHRSAGWEEVEEAYRGALAEIGEDPSDAITDAGRALQAALTLRGCEGNALGPLTKDAVRKGLFAAHDAQLLHWVSADRSEKGDGHKATGATRDDAWFAVHVVGALILRLASDEARS